MKLFRELLQTVIIKKTTIANCNYLEPIQRITQRNIQGII